MSKRKKNIEEPQEDNPFSLSTGDLMAGLMFIFVLIMSILMVTYKEKEESDDKLSKEYVSTKQDLIQELRNVFTDSILNSYGARIIDSTLTVNFFDPRVNFPSGARETPKEFKNVLDDFFPKYDSVLYLKQFRDKILEIRIEGHTDTVKGYEYNMELSQDRTRSVLSYCLGLIKKNDSLYNWSLKYITANGLSYSRPEYNEDGSINCDRSRRVEFKVVTNAELKLREIMEKHNTKDE